MNALRSIRVVLATVVVALGTHHEAGAAGVSLGGFVPMVGIGLTDEFKSLEDLDATFFVADPSDDPDGAFLGVGSTTYYDIAILDTGAATHVLTEDAYLGFDIEDEGFAGTQTFPIGTAGGVIEMEINKALGVYAAGLGDRNAGLTGSTLVMDSNAPLRGQTSFVTLAAPSDEWTLPNVIGLPMAAHHALAILNDDPQIFQYQGRTLRTPQVELRDLGSGGGNILRRAELKLRTGENFIIGPIYTFTPTINEEFELEVIENSPSVLPNSGMFLEIDMANGSKSFADKEFLFDTGADVTVISQATSKKLGFDALLDTPDFFVEVGSPTGVSTGVPGIFVDELNIDTVGGDFTLQNVPVVVLNLPNPNAPGNNLDGLIGMNLFNGRNLVIDAEPNQGQGGNGPSLYISDPITETHDWATAAAAAPWLASVNWSATGTPDKLWLTNVANVSGSDQTALVSGNSQVFQVNVSGTETADMTIHIHNGATLTVFGETRIEQGGRIRIASGSKLNTQFVDVDGGVLTGEGEIFAGTGPIRSPVRILSGRVEPGDPIGKLTIDGDFSNQAAGTLAIELGGTTAEMQYDVLDVDRFAFLAGTLEVNLVGGFIPEVGNTFTILTAGTVNGTFDAYDLPDGYLWDVTYEADSVVLEFVGSGQIGDYNGDGRVSAADFTVWRDSLGAATLANRDPENEGPVGIDDFESWKANYGAGFGMGPGSSAAATVPEPASLLLLALAFGGAYGRCRSRRMKI